LRRRRAPGRDLALAGLWLSWLTIALLAASRGAIAISPVEVVTIVLDRLGLELPFSFDVQQALALWSIRLPRIVMASLIGAALGTAGAATQGLFRNPLADPALIGVSSGASLGAVLVLAFGTSLLAVLPPQIRALLLPLCAFGGGLAATWVALGLARVSGKSHPALLLLTGIAINALTGSLIGLCMYIATEAELRNITFWTLGSVGGATWPAVMASAPFLLAGIVILPRSARALDLLLLGEREAGHLGIRIEQLKRRIVMLTALSVGAAVAAAGVIGFVGLVVPHLGRRLLGPEHRRLLPGSALLGAILLVGADLCARTLVAPAELPLGVITAAIGAPFFLVVIARQRGEATAS